MLWHVLWNVLLRIIVWKHTVLVLHGNVLSQITINRGTSQATSNSFRSNCDISGVNLPLKMHKRPSPLSSEANSGEPGVSYDFILPLVLQDINSLPMKIRKEVFPLKCTTGWVHTWEGAVVVHWNIRYQSFSTPTYWPGTYLMWQTLLSLLFTAT